MTPAIRFAFQVTTRTRSTPAGVYQCGGLPPQRGPNQRIDFEAPHRPRSLGHIVLYVPDLDAPAISTSSV